MEHLALGVLEEDAHPLAVGRQPLLDLVVVEAVGLCWSGVNDTP
jgi:hypothetical protein